MTPDQIYIKAKYLKSMYGHSIATAICSEFIDYLKSYDVKSHLTIEGAKALAEDWELIKKEIYNLV